MANVSSFSIRSKKCGNDPIPMITPNPVRISYLINHMMVMINDDLILYIILVSFNRSVNDYTKMNVCFCKTWKAQRFVHSFLTPFSLISISSSNCFPMVRSSPMTFPWTKSQPALLVHRLTCLNFFDEPNLLKWKIGLRSA